MVFSLDGVDIIFLSLFGRFVKAEVVASEALLAHYRNLHHAWDLCHRENLDFVSRHGTVLPKYLVIFTRLKHRHTAKVLVLLL